VLATVLLVGWFTLLPVFYAELGRETAASAGFIANIYFWNEISYFSPEKLDKVLLHIWSLGVEEQFYLAWPLLLYALHKWRIDLLRALIAVAAVSYVYCLYLTFVDPSAAFYSPLSRCWELAAGGIVATAVARGFVPRAANALSILGAVLMIGGLYLAAENVLFPGLGAVGPVVGTCLVILAGPHASFNRLLSVKPAVWVGLISYPLYLWHWPILSFSFFENALVLPRGIVRVPLMLLAVVLAALTYILVEKPMRRLNPLILIGGMAGLLGIGLAVAADGVPGRSVTGQAGKRLVADYSQILKQDGRTIYRSECGFLDEESLTQRRSIEPGCVAAGERGTHLLWGDSHAQAISSGLRAQLAPGIALAQVATIGCHPGLPHAASRFENPFERACRRNNEAALEAIKRLRPDIVFLAQATQHERTDWDALAQHLLSLGAKRVVLIGPVPQWRPSLPAVAARSGSPIPERISTGLDLQVTATDTLLRQRQFRHLTYVSLIESLCMPQPCLASAGNQLLVVDYGHLSRGGARLAAGIVKKKVEESAD
jgi:peptidoglycan/LPS O-acetylase OafA/YrhL